MKSAGSRGRPGPTDTVVITGEDLTAEQLEAAARAGARAELAPAAAERVARSRRIVEEKAARGDVLYGITTGFGKFADVVISPEETRLLQKNLLRSHAAGVGDPFPDEVVRAMMLLRVNALAAGYSGVRVEVLHRILHMLNEGMHPVVPSQGSLGASGDLAPLAHMALPLIGEGEVRWHGHVMPAADALNRAGWKPLTLEAKEGLALINGTQAMTAVGGLAVSDALKLATVADIAAALTVEVLRGIPAAFDERIHRLRPHPGQTAAAANMRRLLAGSGLTTLPGQLRTQDAYSLRCIPQVHGAYRDGAGHVHDVISREMNAVTDNPLVFPDEDDVVSGGNFHGQPVAQALDLLAVAVADLGAMSERRIERLVNPALSGGLPAFLTDGGGLHSGLMIAQYTAASLAAENKLLASPASVDTIPSSANQEDHVSMGTTAARQARAAIRNLTNILAIELLSACQAAEFTGSAYLSPAGGAVYRLVRTRVAPLIGDRPPAPDIAAIAALIEEGELLQASTAAAGPLL